MDLTIFFSPIDENVYTDITDQGALFKSLRIYGDRMPEYRNAHMALLGVGEERGTTTNQGCKDAPDEIRKKLYRLKRGTGTYNIVDLGNLKPGIDLEEQYLRVSEVCRTLIENNVLPVLLGGTHDIAYGQYRSYEQMNKLISLLNVDAFLDLADASEKQASSGHIQKIVLHEPNYLFGYTHLAHQSYLIDPTSIVVLEKLYFEAYRVGQLHNNMAEMEPAIRHADMLTFDITAIKSADAPGNGNAQPFGLSGEEACQICWYAGMNEKLSSVGFYEYNPRKDDMGKKTASVVATMIWYFMEGFYHRKNEADFKSNDFLKYTVALHAEPETLSFFKSKLTEKWWMEVCHQAKGDRYTRAAIVPCSYTDYQAATRGELPERYIAALSKLI